MGFSTNKRVHGVWQFALLYDESSRLVARLWKAMHVAVLERVLDHDTVAMVW